MSSIIHQKKCGWKLNIPTSIFNWNWIFNQEMKDLNWNLPGISENWRIILYIKICIQVLTGSQSICRPNRLRDELDEYERLIWLRIIRNKRLITHNFQILLKLMQSRKWIFLTGYRFKRAFLCPVWKKETYKLKKKWSIFNCQIKSNTKNKHTSIYLSTNTNI